MLVLDVLQNTESGECT
uniref:Uncharacterized protein n=1 Tax=Arundo donax TaxID=35708 RepID=A0A0A9AYY5_ARUDO